MAFAPASSFAPTASMDWTKVGSPVGIAEMAIEIPSSMRSAKASPRIRPTTRMIASAPQATNPIFLVRSSSWVCSGDRVRVTSPSIPAMCPTSVFIPVAVTRNCAEPRVTEVFWNSIEDWSPSATSSPGTASADFATGMLSPVSAASCVSSEALLTIRPSAGTMSPASTSTRSPGTISVASTSDVTPARTTRARGTCRSASAATLAWAFISWFVPRTTFNVIRAMTTHAVEGCAMTNDTAATATSISVIGSRNCDNATCHTDGGLSLVSELGPYCSRARATCSGERPSRGSLLRISAVSGTDSRYQW